MAEAGQADTNARLAAIIATSDDAIVSKDTTGIVQSWNGAAERIFGYTAQEMIGQPLLRLFPPDRVDEETHILSKICRGERVDHFQTIRIHKSGRPIHVSVTISPIKDAGGRVVGASKIARDITEQVMANRERERLYELSRFLAEETDVKAILQRITDIATELTRAQFGAFFHNVWDERGQSYTLYTIAGVPRSHFEQFMMPRNTEVFAPTFNGTGVVRSDDITQDERYGKSAPHFGMPKGHLPVRSYLAVPVQTRDGRVIGGLFFGHAVPGIFTAHAEAIAATIAGTASIALENARLQRELQRNARKFEHLVNSIPQMAWMATPDGAVFYYNDRWLDYTGIPAERQFGNGWDQVLDPGDRDRVVASWARSLGLKQPWEDTFRIRGRDGTYRWFLSRALPQFDEEGNATYWFGTNTDVTDQRAVMAEREELLVAERTARCEAERLSRMKDEFLATLSHELRTPLNAILGWSQIIRGKREPTLLTEGLAVIERNARAQAQLIEDLLDMSRIISGKLRLDVQRVDPTVVVQRAIEVLKPTADTKGVEIHFEHQIIGGLICGDPGRLQQVLWNLLSNAIKFTAKGGWVRVMLSRAEGDVRITVTDNGAGIDPEFLPHVFERFRQSDSSTTRRFGGLGLGLSIVRQLVELHGGSVSAHSEGLGLGATFGVALPLADVESGPGSCAAAAESTDEISLRSVSVLVVDDEADARTLVAQILDDRDAHVILASDADEALDLVRAKRPQVIVSDIGMPRKDGYELMRSVRALPREQGGETAAIALTAFARAEDRQRAVLAGYQLHLAKPVEAGELVSAIATLARAATA